MTRKDYVRIAAAIAEGRAEADRIDAAGGLSADGYLAGMRYGLATAASLLANVLADDNPRFDKARFMTAALDAGAVTA
jgi:hypothetical protein